MRHRSIWLRNQQESRIIYILVCVYWRAISKEIAASGNTEISFEITPTASVAFLSYFWSEQFEWPTLSKWYSTIPICLSFVPQFFKFIIHWRQHKNLCQLSNIKLYLIPNLMLSTSKVVTFNAHTDGHRYIVVYCVLWCLLRCEPHHG